MAIASIHDYAYPITPLFSQRNDRSQPKHMDFAQLSIRKIQRFVQAGCKP